MAFLVILGLQGEGRSGCGSRLSDCQQITRPAPACDVILLAVQQVLECGCEITHFPLCTWQLRHTSLRTHPTTPDTTINLSVNYATSRHNVLYQSINQSINQSGFL